MNTTKKYAIKMDTQLATRIIHVIAAAQNVSPDLVTLEKTLDELGMDSFDGVNLLFALEEEFNVTLPDEAKDLRTIHDIVVGMQQLLKQQAIAELTE
jgi:acyl carrier protein